MKRFFSYLAAALLLILATACNNRFVPEDVDSIAPYEPLTKAVPLYEQQNRVFGVLDKMVDEIDTSLVMASIKDIMSIREEYMKISKNLESEKMAKSLKVFADLYNSFTTLNGDKAASVFALTKLQGDWKFDADGLTFTPGRSGVSFKIGEKAELTVRFSNKVNEFHIGEAEVPVGMEVPEPKSAYVSLPVAGAGGLTKTFTGVTFRDTVVSDIRAVLPSSVELTATLGGKKVDVSAAISLDGTFNGPFIGNYIRPEVNIKKIMGEVAIDAGLALKVGGYGITIARASLDKGTVKLVSAISKGDANLITEHLTINGLTIDEEAFTKSGESVDKVVVVGDEWKKKFDPAMLKMFDFTGASVDVDLMGGVQIKANVKSPKDFFKCIEDLEAAGGMPTDSAALAGIRKMFADTFDVGLYFGSDVLQSKLVYAPIVQNPNTGKWEFFHPAGRVYLSENLQNSEGFKSNGNIFIESVGVLSAEEIQKSINEYAGRPFAFVPQQKDNEFFMETLPVQTFFVNSNNAQTWKKLIGMHLYRILPFLAKNED